MSQRHFDIAIVGQGIAGTLLGYFLEKYGLEVLVIDNHHQSAASLVAAGIVNPITGKKYVKSWRIDEFLPAALDIYDEIGELLGIECYTRANILRTLEKIEDENSWLGRTKDDLYAAYMVENIDASEMAGLVAPHLNYGEITQSFHVHFKEILKAYKNYCQSKNAYVDALLRYEDLIISENGFGFMDYSFDRIVFCEGYQATENPFFKDIDLQPAKGEVLLIRIPGATFRKMYKDHIFLVHQYEDVYWAGSGYEWDYENDLPTANAGKIIQEELDRILSVPYEILAHIAGVRPSTGNRRPILRKHHEHSEMYLFNGMGTKGASLTPFFARQFARHIVKGDPQDLIV
ncbi:MAG: FAD-binding oxidoreductase [Chitinophagales bacterium]|nr:FAD-binding oxidoreductase [Chitinophagales bacterium]